MKKTVKAMLKISNITFYISLIIAAYALFKIYILYKNLPPGICPLQDMKPLLIISLVFSAINLIFSYIAEIKA